MAKKDAVNIYNSIKYILSKNIIYILGVCLLVGKAVLLNIILKIDIIKDVYFIIFLIPMILMIPCLCKNTKKALIYANSIYFLMTLLIYSNYVYYSFSSSFLSMYQLSNLEYAKEIGVALTVLITLKDIFIFWIDNILCLLISIIYTKKRKEELQVEIPKKMSKRKYIFIILLIFISIYKYFNYVDINYKEHIYNKTVLVEHTSFYYYHIADIKEYIEEMFYKEKIDYQLLEEQYTQNRENKKDEIIYQGMAEGYNVIILQLESLHEYVINKKVNGAEITPNLNKFYNENIYCTNMYNQSLGSTADSEHSIATSMYPLENGMAYQKYFNNTWYAVYNNLSKSGYYTSFMHPNINTFWNRFEVYKNAYKFDEYNDINSFIDTGERAAGFFSDEQFFTQAIDKIDIYKEPFVSVLIGTTGHIPYTLEDINDLENKISIDVSNIEDESFANYLQAVNFVDYSFGLFLNKLENTGLLENTILVVYGDHGAGLTNDESVINLFMENDVEYTYNQQAVENVHIPFGMMVPGLNNIKIENAVAKIDIKPTLANLLGVRDTFSLGENIFSNKDYAFIKGLGFVTSDIYCINENYINRRTNQEIEKTEELQNLKNKMYSDIHLSDTIIKNNLLLKTFY